MALEFCLACLLIFGLTYGQSIIQTMASERVARDLRRKIAEKISWMESYSLQQANPSRLLTNLTSDVDAVKLFVSQAIVSLASSLFIILGVSVLMILINWRLALAVLAIIPIIGGTFFFVLSKVRPLFRKSREIIDWLNRVISESVLGAAIVRVLNAQQPEYQKFLAANANARDVGLTIMRQFAGLIPVIGFTANLAAVTILALGGHYVINSSMTLGDFAAFNSYVVMLIFPIIIIGFMSGIMAQASAAFSRILPILESPKPAPRGNLNETIQGNISLQDVSLRFGEKAVLSHISFTLRAGTKTAILGPTAAGKTQLLYLLTGLLEPDSGQVLYDGRPLSGYDPQCFHSQVGFVFQDSIIFNTSLRENIAFSEQVSEEAITVAVQTAELSEFIQSLPDQLSTVVSERGASLSGGQKQRIMLARALSLNPRVLLLDDFTSRVDARTEEQILRQVERNYPGITLVSVTQQIAPVEHYDEIILLMESELIARGTHTELMENCPEYVQIYQSQRSTSHYELQP